MNSSFRKLASHFKSYTIIAQNVTWRMLSSLDTLKRSQQKQVHTTMRAAVLRQGLEMTMASVGPRFMITTSTSYYTNNLLLNISYHLVILSEISVKMLILTKLHVWNTTNTPGRLIVIITQVCDQQQEQLLPVYYVVKSFLMSVFLRNPFHHDNLTLGCGLIIKFPLHGVP